jgi:hypothetical protein
MRSRDTEDDGSALKEEKVQPHISLTFEELLLGQDLKRQE